LSLLLHQQAAVAQQDCPDGTLWEPYTEVCADVRDARDEFPTDSQPQAGLAGIEELVPGRIAVGTAYSSNQLVALDSGRLHTRMFVYPDGVQPDGPLPFLFTTATSRVNRGLEVVGIYKGGRPDAGQLSLYAWPCLPDYPCPDGETGPGWQWFIDFSTLNCHITHAVDQGGHAQRTLYYANHTDRTDNGTPPQYKSALYLWNYCDAAWDLAWDHTYRQDKVDCSVPGSGCGWWGPGIEIFGEDPYPRVAELGYEDSMLYHDGGWSNLLPPETIFRDPDTYATQTPWLLFHLEPNRSYGVGNWLNDNDAPVIDGQVQLEMLEDEPLVLDDSNLIITDPDVDPAFHSSFELTLYGGANYTHSGNQVLPGTNYSGTLTVPVSVSDGAAGSATYNLQIDVLPVNDAPVFTGQNQMETLERTPLEILLADITFDDPDNDASEVTLSIRDGFGYSLAGNTITPEPGVLGELPIGATISDGALESAPFVLLVDIVPDNIPPEITLIGAASVTLTVGENYQDAGATAVDNVDGDLTDQIAVDNSVNTGRAGTYAVTYAVADVAGNSVTATRTVVVRQAPIASGGSGGGTLSIWTVFLLLLATVTHRSSRRTLYFADCR